MTTKFEIITGEKKEFEKKMNELDIKTSAIWDSTYRAFEYCGKIHYSVMVEREDK